ncbi:hypothetical protein SAMN05216548_10519 [Faunimonas pinastri]|uniref:Uncharacterized protein n=1 Tax=Faunimonas pinastri TaxID=1855383 RepID=A0A1H9GEZ2_9HYPH|nr:hypothetical protein [Faunimonas pinastri]SEQ48690.1 hypothetical protein SAMN05216548_10519 [Faunimonas pinastri]
MSLARTALRLAVIEALKSDPVIADLCGDRIDDSRIPDLDHQEPVPVIIVTTEDDAGEAFSANNGGVPFDRRCDLVLEIAMQSLAVNDEGQPVGIAAPVTDRELEAHLDLLEHRAIEIITVGETAEAALVRKVARRFNTVKSARYATDETGERLAIRLITLGTVMTAYEPDPFATGTYAALPDPLRIVCLAMPAGSSGELLCQMIDARMPGSTLACSSVGIDLTIAPQVQFDPETGPISEADAEAAGTTFGETITLS